MNDGLCNACGNERGSACEFCEEPVCYKCRRFYEYDESDDMQRYLCPRCFDAGGEMHKVIESAEEIIGKAADQWRTWALAVQAQKFAIKRTDLVTVTEDDGTPE